MIDDFVTIYHENIIPRIEINRKMFSIFKEQINFFYPKSNLHVITNLNFKNESKIIYHKTDYEWPYHINKLKLYGFLSKPFMYMDFDIIINKKFENKHILCKNNFNLYRTWRNYDLTQVASIKINDVFKKTPQFNNGIIWIPKPDKNIVKELQEIQIKIFNIPENFKKLNMGYDNDEHTVSYFVKLNNLEMNTFEEVNKLRFSINENNDRNFKLEKNLKEYQTIHYWGSNEKNLFFDEYNLNRKKSIKIF